MSTEKKPLIGSRLSSELYQSFVNYLDNESKRMPPKSLLLREMTQTMNLKANKTTNAIRKKFRNWTKRMALSNGVLIHKPTNKTIIPRMEFCHTIKEIHESAPIHLNVTQTVRQIKSRFSWTSKNFGMNLTDVLMTLSHCQHKKCQKSVRIIKNKLKSESLKLNSEISYSSGNNEHPIEGMSEYLSTIVPIVQNPNTCPTNESIDCDPLDSEEDSTKLFNDLVYKIHLLKIHINLFKVHKFRRNQSFRENIKRCEELIEKIRVSLLN